jgi:predicted nucleic acid-binding protein
MLMGLLTSLADPTALIAADTSTIINLNATGFALEIIRAIPNKFVVVDVVPAELEEGRGRGRRDADLLRQLVSDGLFEIVKLDNIAALHFERLVVGSAAMTLDDGEAATIAFAASQSGIAIIDERKATRISAQLFPELRICCTVDVLASPEVRRSLGREALAQAVFMALQNGRMRVFPQHLKWVVDLIGRDKAAICPSLPSSAREPQALGSPGAIKT